MATQQMLRILKTINKIIFTKGKYKTIKTTFSRQVLVENVSYHDNATHSPAAMTSDRGECVCVCVCDSRACPHTAALSWWSWSISGTDHTFSGNAASFNGFEVCQIKPARHRTPQTQPHGREREGGSMCSFCW